MMLKTSTTLYRSVIPKCIVVLYPAFRFWRRKFLQQNPPFDLGSANKFEICLVAKRQPTVNLTPINPGMKIKKFPLS
ncbi:hypothetical protein D0T26_30010 [Duganella sp. BJB489]|nr:hypothetical protein D0T26_30010 [Duganella sp. BJB489]